MSDLRIGVVVPSTGRLAALGDPLAFVAARFAERVRAVGRRGLRITAVDSRSTAAGAVRAVERLAVEHRVHVVLTLAGSATLPAAADACERLGVPCVSTTLPWQVYGSGRAWGFHFAWGLDDIACAFAEMWTLAAGRCAVGCLWNDGVQGDALRKPEWGFLPACARDGHVLVHEPAYTEGAGDFGAQLAAFADVDVVTSAATAADLAAFITQAGERGSAPRLVTCSRWLTYPFGVRLHDLDRIATIVYWTPSHPYVSGVDGTSAACLARDYQRATGKPWAQPLGLAHALFEVALHAFAHAADPTDHASLAAALGGARLQTIAGPLDWAGGPAPGVARVALAGGQWRAGDRPDLVVVANSGAPDAPIGGELRVGRPARRAR